MTSPSDAATTDAVADAMRGDRTRLIATLARATGDIELAEDALHDAIEAALDAWPVEGVPERPAGWLLTVARRRMIDRIRRRDIGRRRQLDWAAQAEIDADAAVPSVGSVPDDRLELIFACCHPSLAVDARVALTLKSLTALTTSEVARAFLVPEATMAQRIARAKRKVRDAGVPFEVPDAGHLDTRLGDVLTVVYLLFNEGYSASSGDDQVRVELCDEAIRLGRLLAELLPDEAETHGLLALMLLHHSRRGARQGRDGELVVLEHQDRALWDRSAMDEGRDLLLTALAMRQIGPYQLQAAISAVHADATTWADTDWLEIVGLYTSLIALSDSPVVRLNRLVAISMVDGPDVALRELDGLADALAGYGPYLVTRADLLWRSGRLGEARQLFRQASEHAGSEAERRHLIARSTQ